MSSVTANIEQYVVGVDFGTLSGRAVVVRVADGREVGSAVVEYRHGVIDRRLPDGTGPLPPDWALQDPEDWREVLRGAVPAALAAGGVDPAAVIGLATDFTACTVLPTLADGTPLCEVPGLSAEPHAWPKLWKHHAAQGQADRINALAAERGETWLRRYGGKQSSEWEFAKALQMLQEAPDVYDALRTLDRGRRLDRLATHRSRIPQRLHRRLQGDLPGRLLPLRRVPAGPGPALRRLPGHPPGAPRRPGRPRLPRRRPERAGRAVDRPARRHSRGRRKR